MCVFVLSDMAGILTCLDGYMNIALENTEEFVNGEVRSLAGFGLRFALLSSYFLRLLFSLNFGQLKNKYGDAFIRGNNGMFPTDTVHIELMCFSFVHQRGQETITIRF